MEKKIRVIEEFPASLSQKIDILLILGEEKHGTTLHYGLGEYDQQSRGLNPVTNCWELNEENFEKTTVLLNELNLSYNVGDKRTFFSCPDDPSVPSAEYIPIYIGRNEKWKKRTTDAYEKWNEREIGICEGFPRTAIEAYLDERPRLMENLDDGTPLGYFNQFIKSEEFYLEELETSLRWHDIVKELSPRLYWELELELERDKMRRVQ